MPEAHSEFIRKTQLIYFGSLVQRSKAGYENLQNIIARKSPPAVCFYDINLRPGCYNNTAIKKSLTRTNILKLNEEELDSLKQSLFFKENHPDFIHYLMGTYPLDIVSLTKGHMGSELYSNKDCYRLDTVKDAKVVDTVGAGDAYAAMLAAGFLRGWRPQKILERASMFASHICEIKGAIPDSPSFYKPFRRLFGNG